MNKYLVKLEKTRGARLVESLGSLTENHAGDRHRQFLRGIFFTLATGSLATVAIVGVLRAKKCKHLHDEWQKADEKLDRTLEASDPGSDATASY